MRGLLSALSSSAVSRSAVRSISGLCGAQTRALSLLGVTRGAAAARVAPLLGAAAPGLLPVACPLPQARTARAVRSASSVARASPAAEPAWFGLGAPFEAALDELGIKAPSDVQRRSIPALMSGRSGVVAAPTGTGKTLAYLLPALHRMKAAEAADGKATRAQRPRIVVLVPTRELALQILSVSKSLCHSIKFRAAAVVGGGKQSTVRKALSSPVDVVVATPGRLALMLEQGSVYLSDLQTLIVDEADTLAAGAAGFGEDVEAVLKPLRAGLARAAAAAAVSGDGAAAASRSVQFILAGATFPAAVHARLKALFPEVVAAASASGKDAVPVGSLPTSQTLPPGLRQTFLRVGGEPDAKHSALLSALRPLTVEEQAEEAGEDDRTAVARQGRGGRGSSGGAVALDLEGGDGEDGEGATVNGGGGGRLRLKEPVLVFCNTIPSARSTAHRLQEEGFSVASLHGAIPPELRAREFARFCSGSGRRLSDLLVCTDAAARGLDFPGLRHVVLFDFPLSPVDYVHRAGRVARGGRSGAVVSLVGKRDVVLAKAIQTASAAGLPVAHLSADKEVAARQVGWAAPAAGRGGREQGYAAGRGADPAALARRGAYRSKTTVRVDGRGGARGRSPAAAADQGAPRQRYASERNSNHSNNYSSGGSSDRPRGDARGYNRDASRDSSRGGGSGSRGGYSSSDRHRSSSRRR